MNREILFVPPEQGRLCSGCTKCCTWLVGEAFGQTFGDGHSCYFLKEDGCGVYESRPIGCRSFQCLWKTDLDIPLWLKPDHVDVILKKERLSRWEYISISFAGSPDSRVLEWARSQQDKNFIVFDTKEVISQDGEFKNFLKVMNKIL
jgi:hypothetical protein